MSDEADGDGVVLFVVLAVILGNLCRVLQRITKLSKFPYTVGYIRVLLVVAM